MNEAAIVEYVEASFAYHRRPTAPNDDRVLAAHKACTDREREEAQRRIRTAYTKEQAMNSSREAVDDASARHGLAPTTTPSGAGPSTGARKVDHEPPPASQASGSGSGGDQQT